MILEIKSITGRRSMSIVREVNVEDLNLPIILTDELYRSGYLFREDIALISTDFKHYSSLQIVIDTYMREQRINQLI